MDSQELIDASEIMQEMAENMQEFFRKSISFLKKFWRRKGAKDACSLYMFLLYWAYEQKTNTIYCTNTFIKEGLQMGDDSLRRGFRFLEGLQMVERVLRRDDKGIIIGKYIKLKRLHDPIKQGEKENIHVGENPHLGKTTHGKTGTNAYKDNNKKNNTYKEISKARFKNRVSQTEEENNHKDSLPDYKPLLPDIDMMKKSMNDNRIKKIKGRPAVTRKDMFDFFRSMRMEYGYTVKGLNATEEDLRYAGHIAKKIEHPREYIENTVKNWKQLREKITYEGSTKSKLPVYPDLKNLWLSREAIAYVSGMITVTEKREIKKYTSIDQLPIDIPNRKTFENIIKTVGFVEIQ